MHLSRRAMFVGLAAIAAPAVIRTPGMLMPIKPLWPSKSFLVFESENAFRYLWWEGDVFGEMTRTLGSMPPQALENGRFMASRDVRSHIDITMIRERSFLLAMQLAPYHAITFRGCPVEAVSL